MIKYLLLFLLPFSLYASKVLSYNIYERSDRADVMITFDTPFHGSIKQSKSKNSIIIKLQEATIESTKIKKVNSSFLHSLKIKPLKNQIYIYASVSPKVKLIASKTADAYGLRLRFVQSRITKGLEENENSSNQSTSSLPTKKETLITTNYIIVVSLLFIGVILLLLFKKKIIASRTNKEKGSWLFNTTTQNNQTDIGSLVNTHASPNSNNSPISIRFQKVLDNNNSVVMLDFGEESYLIFMGNNSFLLDKFSENRPSSQQEFETILQERNQELENFLGSNSQNKKEREAIQEPLQAYKERAAFIYNEE